MRIPKSDLKSLLRPIETNPALSNELIQAAQSGNTSLWAKTSSAAWNNLAQAQGVHWGHSRAKTLALAATTFGIPQGDVQSKTVDAMENIFDFAMLTPTSLGDLRIKFAKMGISIVTAALSPIPIVGAIANAVGGLANMLIELFTAEAEEVKIIFPPAQEYTEEVDAAVAEGVRLQMGDPNWTPLFMPRFSTNIQIQRRGEEGRTMFLSGGPGPGLGYVPGTQRILGALQADADRDQRMPRKWRGGFTANLGDYYPTAAQLATALYGQVAEPGPYLYLIDTLKIESAWENYVGAMIDFARSEWDRTDTYGRTELTNSMKWMYALKAEGKWMWGFVPPWSPEWEGPTIVDAFVKPAMSQLRKRQKHQLGKLTVAYCTEEGHAFKNLPLKLRLNSMRQRLLTHPARYEVNLDDVIDSGYLQALRDSGVTGIRGPQVLAAEIRPEIAIDPDNPPQGYPPPPQGGAPGFIPKMPSKWFPWLVAAGLGGGAYYAYKNRRRLVKVFS